MILTMREQAGLTGPSNADEVFDATLQEYTLARDEDGEWVAQGVLRLRGPGVQPVCCQFNGATGYPPVTWTNLFDTADPETQRRIVEGWMAELIKERFAGGPRR